VYALALVPVEEQVLIVFGKVLPRHVEVDPVLVADRLRELLVVVVPGAPRQDRSLVDREPGVDRELRVDLHLRAEARAARTRAVRRVEREAVWLQLGYRSAAAETR